MERILVLIPAAGRGARMRGGDKHLETVGGQPLLVRLVRACAGLELLVTVPSLDHPRALALAGSPSRLALGGPGLSDSLRAGAAAAAGRALMVLPGDMPEIGAPEVARVVAAYLAAPERVVRGSAGGRAGHPVVIPPRLVPGLLALPGDVGAASVIGAEPPLLVPLEGLAAVTDLDTPEAWAAWRAGRG